MKPGPADAAAPRVRTPAGLGLPVRVTLWILLWLVLVGAFTARLGGAAHDDFFITYRYAWNLAHGDGLVFNPGERVFGTTAPGLALLLALGHLLTRVPIHWLGTLSTAAALLAVAVLLLREAAARRRGSEGTVAGTLIVGSSVLWAVHGAEGQLVVALLLAAAALPSAGRWGPGAAGCVAGFAVWLRPDAVVGAGLLGVLLLGEWWSQLRPERRSDPGRGRSFPWLYGASVGAVILLGLWLAGGWFGEVLPNTWAAKRAAVEGFSGPSGSGTGAGFWSSGLPLARRHLGKWFPLVLGFGAAGLVPLARHGGRPGRLLAANGLAMALIYPFLGTSFALWYAIPVMIPLLAGAGFGTVGAGRWVGWLAGRVAGAAPEGSEAAGWGRWPARGAAVLVGSALVLAVGWSVGPAAVRWVRGAERPLHHHGYRLAGEWIAQNAPPDAAVATVEIGTLAYFADRRVEDLMGLVTPRSIPFVAAGDLEGAFLARPAEYVVVRPGLMGLMGRITTRPWFREGYEEAIRLLPGTRDWVAIYRRLPGARVPPPRPPEGAGSPRTAPRAIARCHGEQCGPEGDEVREGGSRGPGTKMERMMNREEVLTTEQPSDEPESDDLAARLRSHVETLAGEIGERNVWRGDSLSRAAGWIEAEWEGQGFEVRRQIFVARGVECANLEVTIPGAGRPDEIVLLGAHYDTVEGCPGANDNGTGVAALLEISRMLREAETPRTLRLVAFANEEPPFFLRGDMGSRVHARRARERGDDLRTMVALETIGYYSDAKGSQSAPPVVGWFYPTAGNFLAFVGSFRARAAVHRAAEAFRGSTGFPAERVVLPALVPGVSWSDHRCFWKEGYQDALMVTDTAPYRYPHYHLPTDTPDRIDYPSLAEVTRGLAGMAVRLARPA